MVQKGLDQFDSFVLIHQLIITPCQVFKASPVCKFVTKRDPVLLNQYLKAIKGKNSLHHVLLLPHKRFLWKQYYHEALDGAVVGVHEQSSQRADLSCPVPPI